VVDVQKAEISPAESILASVYAGCSPVRVVLSHDSEIAWVTARAADEVLAFSTRALLEGSSPGWTGKTGHQLPALLSTTPIGIAPVGIQLFDHDRFIAVANSNRFTPGEPARSAFLITSKLSTARATQQPWEHSLRESSLGNGLSLQTTNIYT
jgi:hypothetical protein